VMIPLVCLRLPDTNKPVPAGQKAFSCKMNRELCRNEARERRQAGAGLLLRPINIVAKFRIESFNVEAKHAVNPELAQFTRIACAQGIFFLWGKLIAVHDGFEVFQRSLIDRLVHF
jgi:hypothetical protein